MGWTKEIIKTGQAVWSGAETVPFVHVFAPSHPQQTQRAESEVVMLLHE